MAIYLGAGSVKIPTAIYVGAGGVKTVSEIYVGIGGSPKKVWPVWSNGEGMFDDEELYWWMRRYRVNGDWTQQDNVSKTSTDSYFDEPFWSLSLGGNYNNDGFWIATTSSINASSVNYIYIYAQAGMYGGSNSRSYTYYAYASVNSSRSTMVNNDSGYGECTGVTVNGSNLTGNLYGRTYLRFCIDLTGCTRTGYFKFMMMEYSAVGNTGEDYFGRIGISHIDYYSSKPTAAYTITVT